MTPIKFKGFEKILGAPADWDEKKHRGPCLGLPVLVHDGSVISVWKLTWRERLAILFGRKLVVHVVSGRTQPPIGFTVMKIKEQV